MLTYWTAEGGPPFIMLPTITVQIAKAILENKGDVNQADDYGNQPLMTAAVNYKGNKERFAIVELFLQHGADKNYKGKSGTSPVDFARIASPSLLELFSRY